MMKREYVEPGMKVVKLTLNYILTTSLQNIPYRPDKEGTADAKGISGGFYEDDDF